MDYTEVKVHLSPAGLEVLTALLTEHGVTGLVIDDPREIADLAARKTGLDWDYFDESLLAAGAAAGDEITVTFYTEVGPEGTRRLEDIRLDIMKLKAMEADGGFGETQMLGRLYTESFLRSDEEWKDEWKRYFKPFRLTSRLTVRPSWEAYAPFDADELVMELDPGMAFGTGKHETTALCALMLSECVRPGSAVLDIGCGSGILSVAAALMGAGDVLGVDIDETAVSIARENVMKNGCADRVNIVKGDLLAGLSFKADVAVANLTAELIAELAQVLRPCLKSGGIFIASGILTERCALAEDAVRAAGFRIEESLADGEWRAFKAARA
ncbi:MAG: 50S ribosomal protein L11 methyltransferase [Clostridiales Family XIII bacterium]|jgi:ribosomal protein L11 methyltransferase|nr:50S ribosomal protein L11 methyltransferase [Clostridiales Family XIII bacterium]